MTMMASGSDTLAGRDVLARRPQVFHQPGKVALRGAQISEIEGLAQGSHVVLDRAVPCTCRMYYEGLASGLVGLYQTFQIGDCFLRAR